MKLLFCTTIPSSRTIIIQDHQLNAEEEPVWSFGHSDGEGPLQRPPALPGSYLGLGVVNWKHWEATGGRICREKDPGFNR